MLKRLLSNKKIRIIIIAAAAVLLVAAAVVIFLLRDRLFAPKEEEIPVPEPIEAPIQYTLGEVKFLALPAGSTALVYDLEADTLIVPAEDPEAEKPTEEDAATEEEAGAEEAEPSPLVGYRYEGMTDAAEQVRAYVALLTTEDMGFLHADETLKDLEEAPDLSAGSGTAHLICRLPKPEEEGAERQAIALRLQWEATGCKVTTELVPAAMTYRPEPPSNTLRPQGGTVLTFSSAVDTIKGMCPSVLELEGESMEDYRIYSRDGLALIDGQSCMRIDIYKRDEKTGTNTVKGNYFLSSDGLHLYRLNEETKTVRELPMDTIA